MREVYYHRKVPEEAREVYHYYRDEVSQELADAFWIELETKIEYAREFPERHHFDLCGRRRSNLKRFPIHFLFRVFPDYIRVTVIRQNKRHPSHGTGRK